MGLAVRVGEDEIAARLNQAMAEDGLKVRRARNTWVVVDVTTNDRGRTWTIRRSAQGQGGRN